MTQKLSAWNYIKNNKRRISVLVVSLSLCFMTIYITQFMLGTTVVSASKVFIGNYSKMQFISLAGSSFGLDVEHLSLEALDKAYVEENTKLMDELQKEKGVEHVYYVPVIYNEIVPVTGSIGVEVPLMEKTEDVETVMKHMGATLVEGRLPQNPGELVVDEASMKNNDYRIGEAFKYNNDFKIVGIVSCDSYFGVGLTRDGYYSSDIFVLSDGSIGDMEKVLERNGIKVRDTYDTIKDKKVGEKWLKEDVEDVIANSTTIIYVGVLVLLSLALFIVYTMYLRDRHNEWCLYCSIGYSKKAIYYAILRELLFSFVCAILIGGVLIVLMENVLEILVITPQGVFCKFWYPEVLVEILCAYVFLFGLLQIPVHFALWRIRTVDAMDDDMY